jgi:hypothetical protein
MKTIDSVFNRRHLGEVARLTDEEFAAQKAKIIGT